MRRTFQLCYLVLNLLQGDAVIRSKVQRYLGLCVTFDKGEGTNL